MESKPTTMPPLLCTPSHRGQWWQVTQLVVSGSTHVTSGRKRNPEEACLGLGGSHTPRADGTSRSKQAGTPLKEQNPREGQPRLLLVTWLVNGRVEKSEDGLERGGGHD